MAKILARFPMITARITLMVATLLVATIFNAQAQAPDYRFDQLTLDDGLSDNTVYSIAQDKTGYLWFGTQNGLNRYDGYNFTVFRNDPFNPNTVSNDNAGNIYADREGNIWIGTWGGGLDKYDPETGQFTNYQPDPTVENSISYDRVQTIFQDRAGNIWIGTAGGGLNKLDPVTEQFTVYVFSATDPNSLSNDRIWRIAEDDQGNLWIATSSGLNRLNPNTEQFTHYFSNPSKPHSLSHSLIRTLFVDRSGTLWVGTEQGLNRYNSTTDDFEVYLHDPADQTTLSDNIINSIYEDSQGRFWVGTRSGGLNLLDRKSGTFTSYVNNPTDPTSLSYNDVRWIHEDYAGVLWLGTRGGGLNKLVPTSGQFIHFANDPSNPNSLSRNDVRAIFESSDGLLWVGTQGGGLNRFNPQTGQNDRFVPNPIDPNSLGSEDIFAIYQDSSDTMWFGTSGAGLDRFDPQTGIFTHFQSNPNDPDSLGSMDVNTIFEDTSGDIWIGTKGGGLSRFDRSTEKFSNYVNSSTDPNSIGNNDVFAIHQDQKNVIWVGTYGGGLNRFNSETGNFTHFKFNPEDINSLSDNNIYDIHEDKNGILWIATANGGLNQFDPQAGTARRFGKQDGLASDVVYSIISDDAGNLWLSTNQGITRLDPNTFNFVNFDTSDGLTRVVYREGAAFEGRDGAVYFGGINCFTKFYPDEITTNDYVPEIVLTELSLFNRPLDTGMPLNQLGQLNLSFEEDMLGFEFAALDFTDPDKNQFAYKLDGFDSDWNHTGSRPFATYTNLDPGRYTLRIKGSNNAGVWNDGGLSLEIIVTPPFWETWWFRTVAVLAVLGLGFVVYKIRVSAIEKQRKILKVQVSERTAELTAANQSLQEVTNRLQAELALAQKIQDGLLPPASPLWTDLDIVCYSRPANEVGGDFYDYYELDSPSGVAEVDAKRRFAVLVGDVSGKGMPAALMMGVSMGSLQSIMAQVPAQEAVMAQLNGTLLPYTKTTGQNCALCYVEICDGTVSVLNAGGIPPIVRHVDGSTRWFDSIGLPLGIVIEKPRRYQKTIFPLVPGDMIIMVSDGVIEVCNASNQMLGFDRFETVVQAGPNSSAEAMLDHLKRKINAFVGTAEPNDDLTLVIIRCI